MPFCQIPFEYYVSDYSGEGPWRIGSRAIPNPNPHIMHAHMVLHEHHFMLAALVLPVAAPSEALLVSLGISRPCTLLLPRG